MVEIDFVVMIRNQKYLRAFNCTTQLSNRLFTTNDILNISAKYGAKIAMICPAQRNSPYKDICRIECQFDPLMYNAFLIAET